MRNLDRHGGVGSVTRTLGRGLLSKTGERVACAAGLGRRRAVRPGTHLVALCMIDRFVPYVCLAVLPRLHVAHSRNGRQTLHCMNPVDVRISLLRRTFRGSRGSPKGSVVCFWVSGAMVRWNAFSLRLIRTAICTKKVDKLHKYLHPSGKNAH